MKNTVLQTVTAATMAAGICYAPISTWAQWSPGLVSTVAPSPYVGNATQADVFPLIQYKGERFFISGLDVGYTLFENTSVGVGLLGSIRYEGYNPDHNPALAGMDARKASFDAGALLIAGSDDWGVLQSRVLTDVSSMHGGQELSLSYGVPFKTQRFEVTPALGVAWRSRNLVDYYYGVRPNEARSGRPAYRGRAATLFFVNVEGLYHLTETWQMIGGITCNRLPEAVTDSPIVQNNFQVSGYMGLVYQF